MLDTLHDEVDELERVRDEAREIAERVIRENLKAVVAETKDIGAAMVRLTQLCEDELTDRTTEWFRLGASFAEKRAGK